MSESPTTRHPFRFPLPADALLHFCHPVRPGYTAPVRHPADGHVYAASGYCALRTSRFHGFPEEYPEAPAPLLERLDSLPWSSSPDLPDSTRPAEWRPLDSARGTIYRDPGLPLWTRQPAKRGLRLTTDVLVRVAGAPIIPLALLQLLARLPRAEIRVTAATLHGPVLVRFHGGEAIVPHLGHLGPARFELFKIRQDLFPRGML